MRAVSIYPDSAGRTLLEQALGERDNLTLCRSFHDVPEPENLARALRAWAPAVIFLDITEPQIEEINSQLAADFPGILRVGIHPTQTPEVFRRVLHLGMCELINPPFGAHHMDPVLERLASRARQQPAAFPSTGRICAFLPAKAGVGASTIAAHATWAASENHEAHVLQVDFDRHSGITAFQFNMEPDFTLMDALLSSVELDEVSWHRLIKTRGNIDLLLSQPGDLSEASMERYVPPLMQFASRNYSHIHVDLPDTLDSQTLAVLHQSDQIFIVTTPELPALRLARLKVAALEKLDLEGRTRLILNRMNHRLGLSQQDIESAVGLEVYSTFVCDYDGVTESLRTARPAPKLLKNAHALLAKAGAAPAPESTKRWRFLERITVPVPGRTKLSRTALSRTAALRS